MLKLILFSIALVAMIHGIFAVLPQEQEARIHCRSLYQTDPDEQGTFFTNFRCKVQCNFTNQIRHQEVNSGQSCGLSLPNADRLDYICQSGQCKPRQVPPHHQGPPTSPNVFPTSNRQNGQLTILSTKADLSIPEKDTYLMICVLNNVAEPIHHLPLEDNYWINRCYSCSSDIVQETRTPTYITPCPMSERYTINQNSRIIFEIWTYDSTPTSRSPSGKPGKFIGGTHLRLKELIDRRNLGHPYSMRLIDGSATGTLTTEIEWS
ncbi:uncharacterized protein LOC113799668 [Dermatophagoides pteronyssinus]|uniref:Secreted protein n=1 Tax=Dermatophagoides pteronyssinus TaxID=6956 RepID=A0ABQ8JDD5_DERPT|nr:hypothetical protein DERP_001051 [Dermatophagoides pteronyssinus]